LSVDRENAIMGLHSTNPDTQVQSLAIVGQMGESEAVQLGLGAEVGQLLSAYHPEVRAAACRALAQLGEAGAAQIHLVAKLLTSSDDVKVKIAAMRVIGCFAGEGAHYAKLVEPNLDDKEVTLRENACICLGMLRQPGAAALVAAHLDDPEDVVVCAALAGLGHLSEQVDAQDVAAIGAKLDSQNVLVCLNAAKALRSMGSHAEKYLAKVVPLLASSEQLAREAALSVFESHGARAASEVSSIAEILSHQNGGARAVAALSLGAIGADAGQKAEAVAALLSDEEECDEGASLTLACVRPRIAPELRKPACAAALALPRMGKKAVAPFVRPLAGLLLHQHYECRVSAIKALSSLGSLAMPHGRDLLAALEDKVPFVVTEACAAVGRLAKNGDLGGNMRYFAGEVAPQLTNRYPTVRCAAAEALGAMGAEGAVFAEEVAKLFHDRVWTVRVASVTAMSHLGEEGQMYAAEVIRMTWDPETPVRVAALHALGRMGARGAAFADEAAACLQDPMHTVRVEAEIVLAQFHKDQNMISA